MVLKLWARSLITPNFWYLGSRFKGNIIQSVDVLFVFNPQRNCCKSSGTLKVITEFHRLGSWLSLSWSFSCLRAGDKQDLAVWRVESVLLSSLPLEKDVTYSRRCMVLAKLSPNKPICTIPLCCAVPFVVNWRGTRKIFILRAHGWGGNYIELKILKELFGFQLMDQLLLLNPSIQLHLWKLYFVR